MAFLKDARQAELVIVDLAYPLTDQEILNITREVIEREVAKGGSPLRMAMFDAISSVPGVRFPYEAMVKLVREYGILSVVDGAHAIGWIYRIMCNPSINPDKRLCNVRPDSS